MREVRIPVATLLAFIGGSDSDMNEAIANLLGNEVTDDEIQQYTNNHYAEQYRRDFAAATVDGWRKDYNVKGAA